MGISDSDSALLRIFRGSIMKFLRGFHLKKHLVSIIPRSSGRRRYLRLDSSDSDENDATRAFRWCNWVKQKATWIWLCSARAGSSYSRIEREKTEQVPKGFLAVYVGRESGDESRVLVPVIYFNHPLFGELLKEAEDEFGYEHPGGIKLPCRISEFEKVQTTIRRGFCGGGKLKTWRRKLKLL
ncbi:hypothetical protein QQ045_032710 [Rhodiola kirilowii]